MTTTKHRCAFCAGEQDDCDVMVVDLPDARAPTICGDCIRSLTTGLARVMAEKQAADLLGPIHRRGHHKWVESKA